MEENTETESMSQTELIGQLNAHATHFLKQLNTAKDLLQSNNRKIGQLKDVITKYDASVDVASFTNQKPELRYSRTVGSIEIPQQQEDESSELELLIKHLPHLRHGVQRYREAIERQDAILATQTETIDKLKRTDQESPKQRENDSDDSDDEYEYQPSVNSTCNSDSESDDNNATPFDQFLNDSPVKNVEVFGSYVDHYKTFNFDKTDTDDEATIYSTDDDDDNQYTAENTKSSYIPQLFDHVEEEQIDYWIQQYRNGKKKLPSGSHEVIVAQIKNAFKKTITTQQFRNWMSDGAKRKNRKNRKSAPYSKLEIDEIAYLRDKNHTWKSVQKELSRKFPRFRTILPCGISGAYKRYEEAEGKRKGEWTEAENEELLCKVEKYGNQWSAYRMKTRSKYQIKGRCVTLSMQLVNSLQGRSCRQIMLESFEETGTKNPTYAQWFEQTKPKLFDVPTYLAKLMFARAMDGMELERQIIRQGNSFTLAVKNQCRPRRQQLHFVFHDYHIAHINQLLSEASELRKSDTGLRWMNNNVPFVATTTTQNYRQLNFRATNVSLVAEKESFIHRFLFSNAIDDVLGCDECDEIDEIDEIYESVGSGLQFNVLAILSFKPSHQHPEESKKKLLMVTSSESIYAGIHSQLKTVLTLRCCPSWLQAFVVYQLEIDWDKITILAVCEGAAAALRLKWMTVRIAQPSLFNLRSTSFTPIINNREFYLDKLKAVNLILDEGEWNLHLKHAQTTVNSL